MITKSDKPLGQSGAMVQSGRRGPSSGAAGAHEYDYIIVGAGSAGCVLAARLSEDPGARVLLLEAGGWDRHPLIRIPLGWPRLLLDRIADWGYETEPDAALGGRSMECARGKVVGGSSSTNAMVWVKGHPADFDRWAAAGLEGWDHQSLLPCFRRLESWAGGASELRGGSGPVGVEENGFDDPIGASLRQAAAARGYRVGGDYNAVDQEGFAPWQTTRRNGVRHSAARAFLYPALGRANLDLRVGARVSSIVWEGRRAVGVRVSGKDGAATLRAGREVILSAGAINTPQLLMLSGVGPADHLRSLGIDVRSDLPGVGGNLQDHISCSVVAVRSDRGGLTRTLRLDRLAVETVRWLATGRGALAALPVCDMGFLTVRSGAVQPDLQVMAVAGALAATPWLPPFRKPAADMFALRAAVLHPKSRGRITLASADPMAAPRIEQNFLSHPDDRALLRDGLRLLLDLAQTAPLSRHVSSIAGPTGRDDAALDAHIDATGVSVHHPCGTCRMGGENDAMRVVDGRLRVVGMEGLRVVDASVMPDITGGNINAPVMMIAERAAELMGAAAGTREGN